MRTHFIIKQIRNFNSALFFLFKQPLSHLYLTALFVSGEEDIDVRHLEMLFQSCIEKKRAVCWISSVQKNDVKRDKRMKRDSRGVILSLTGIVQKINVFKSRTQFHTSHFRRWYEYGDVQIGVPAKDHIPLHTTPIGAAKTSVLYILPVEYSRYFERIYGEYEGRFHKSPFIDTEHNTLMLRLDVVCKTSKGELIAEHSFFQEGEPREQHMLTNRFVQDVAVWLCELYS